MTDSCSFDELFMNDSSVRALFMVIASVVISRKEAVQILSEERGRSQTCPLDSSLISKWCADLGFRTGLREFDETQMAKLKAVNRHYAQGKSRKQLIKKMEDPKWYLSQN